MKNIIIASGINILLLTSATAETEANVPDITELRDEANIIYGLDLEKVDIRQKKLRKQGVANDIATKIVLFRSQKTYIKKLVENKLNLEKKMQTLKAKTSFRKSERMKIETDIEALQEELDIINGKIKTAQNIQKETGKTIMNEMGLTATQLAKIPPK